MQPFLDVETAILPHEDGLLIHRVQQLPDSLLDGLKSERLASAHLRTGEHHKVACVPAQVFDVWAGRGLEPFKMTAREVVAQLRKEGLEAFITTSKRV